MWWISDIARVLHEGKFAFSPDMSKGKFESKGKVGLVSSCPTPERLTPGNSSVLGGATKTERQASHPKR